MRNGNLRHDDRRQRNRLIYNADRIKKRNQDFAQRRDLNLFGTSKIFSLKFVEIIFYNLQNFLQCSFYLYLQELFYRLYNFKILSDLLLFLIITLLFYNFILLYIL